MYVVRLSQRIHDVGRDWIVSEMKARGIALGRYFAPIHLQPIYKYSQHMTLSVTESQASRAIALPFFNRIQQNEIEEVCRTLVELINGGLRQKGEN